MIQLSKEERTKQRLQTALKDFGCRIELVGSVALGCTTNVSDIDLVVFGAGEWPLLRVTESIQRARIAIGKVKPIQNARVPIVTYMDAQSQLNVDISFDQQRDVDLCEKVVEMLDRHEGSRAAILQVKQWAAKHHVPLTGFCIVVMVLSLYERGLQNTASFWDAYRNFDCSKLAITLHGVEERQDDAEEDLQLLFVCDPLDHENNLAKACGSEWRNYFDIKK
jgi:DNA polymerase sigma